MKVFCIISVVLVAAFGVNADVSRNVDDLKFMYYDAPVNSFQIRYNEPSSFDSAPFKASAQTVIVIDGFLSNLTTPMSQTIKNAYLAADSSRNVIVLDWGKLSGSGNPARNIIETGLLYNKVLNNVGPVGKRVAEFIQFLTNEQGISAENVHVVGHSLGSHVAGAAGVHTRELYGKTLGRISGLDPAGPFFEGQNDMRKRLDKTDAQFVDMYHTNRGDMGDSDHQTASVNFYVNGGDNQPGCAEGDVKPAGFCSHSYSWKFYSTALSETIKACPCSGLGCQCKNCEINCASPIRAGEYMPTNVQGPYLVNYGPIA